MGTKVPEVGTSRSKVGIADALFTKTQQRVLGALFRFPGRSYSQAELFEIAGGRGSVQRELERLSSSGLVGVTIVGKRRLYRANTGAPVFAELHGLVVRTIGIADPVRAALAPHRARIRLATIYGSVAKGTAGAESDVDLLIVADGLSLEDVFRIIGPAETAVGRRINPTLLSSAEYDRRRRAANPFLTAILAGPQIPVLEEQRGASEAR